jgi:antitoxin component of RelBE/YafQ-DinJ toxin-antitoxin module
MAKQVVTSIRIDDDLWKAARIYAISEGITLTELIERLLQQELENKKYVFKLLGEHK